METRYRVTIWEHEHGWGHTHFLDMDFDTWHDAHTKFTQVNTKNLKHQSRDYYLLADPPRLVDAKRHPPQG
jgi:hypothetical protein